HEIAQLAVRDIGFRAVDDVLVAFATHTGAHASHVAACAGFGDADGTDHLALDHAGQPLALEFFAGEALEIGGNHVRMDVKAGPGDPGAPQLFGHHRVVQEVAARAAVFFSHVAAQNACFTCL